MNTGYFSNYLQLYLDRTFDLAETIVVKSDYAASELNKHLPVAYARHFDPEDRRTWKYYLNIAGEYHASDEMMYVRSMDTLETIEFTKENLSLHRSTARSYQYNTRQYRELVVQYPQQEQLILGILYPCELNAAIEAEDYSILSYPPHLVEEYEYSLIPRLEAWIKRFVERWNNTQYRITDDLYEAAMLGIMHQHTITALLSLRLEAAKTDEVHSFYIKQYFASHGYLDRYLDSLNRKQILFLYRNLPWIMRNAGKDKTFRTLIEKLLVERNILLVSYRMTHDIADLVETLENLPRFKQVSENRITNVNEEIYALTNEILIKQDPLASENVDIRTFESTNIENEFRDSLSNRLQTKSLESNMYDYSDSGPYRLSEILLDHWVYLAANGRYNSYVQIVNPTTGLEFPLHVKDAYVLAQYILNYSNGYVLTKIPKFTVKRVQRVIQPTTDELLSIVDKERFDASYVADLTQHRPTINWLISSEAFYDLCKSIHLSVTYQRYVAAYHEDFRYRGQSQAMAALMYGSRECELADYPDQLYADWFQSRNIEIEDFLIPDIIDNTYNDIVNAVTGLDLGNNRSIKNIQFDMIKMMEQLSSYSVHYLRTINSSSIEIAGWPVVRPSEPVVHGLAKLGFAEINVDPLRVRAYVNGFLNLKLRNNVDAFNLRAGYDSFFKLDLPSLIGRNLAGRYGRRERFFLSVSRLHVKSKVDNSNHLNDVMIPVPGMEDYLALSQEERLSLPEVVFN